MSFNAAKLRQPRSPRPAHLLFLAVIASGLTVAGCGGFTSRGLNSQGVRLFDQARYQDAIHRFQEAIDKDPKSADGYYNLAATYHRLGEVNRSQQELARAEQHYHLCLDHNPDHRECYRGLAVLLAEQDRSEEAFRLFEGWAAQSPGLPDPKIEMARLLEEFGDPEAASQQLIDALAMDDHNPRALAALGRLREQMGDPAQAMTAYQRSLFYDRFQPDVAARVASLQATVGATTPAVGPETTPPGFAPPGETRTAIGNRPTIR